MGHLGSTFGTVGCALADVQVGKIAWPPFFISEFQSFTIIVVGVYQNHPKGTTIF